MGSCCSTANCDDISPRQAPAATTQRRGIVARRIVAPTDQPTDDDEEPDLFALRVMDSLQLYTYQNMGGIVSAATPQVVVDEGAVPENSCG